MHQSTSNKKATLYMLIALKIRGNNCAMNALGLVTIQVTTQEINGLARLQATNVNFILSHPARHTQTIDLKQLKARIKNR